MPPGDQGNSKIDRKYQLWMYDSSYVSKLVGLSHLGVKSLISVQYRSTVGRCYIMMSSIIYSNERCLGQALWSSESCTIGAGPLVCEVAIRRNEYFALWTKYQCRTSRVDGCCFGSFH